MQAAITKKSTLKASNRPTSTCRQRGVAIVTALLLTALAVTIVASVFWQQQVQVRAVENQRLQSQTQWVQRAALDWTRIILREDARTTAVDQLGEVWATPLPETPLDDYIEKDGSDSGNSGASGGTLSGKVIDAQSYYNLNNLAVGGVVDPQEIAVFKRLLGFLSINPNLAEATAKAIGATQAPTTAPSPPANTPDSTPASTPSAPSAGSTEQPALFIHTEDLITIPGYTVAVIDKLKNYVVILPRPTPVNVNTAGVEVLAAKANLSMEKATAMIASRSHAYFITTNDFQSRAQVDVPSGKFDIAVSTSFFMVFNKVQWDRASLNMQALIYRKSSGNTTVMWLREY
ncbi:type II secretion system minor pseudopilin GspK [Solimicrobium silvestre]|uniref:Type II secretion system protein K n=1 Tax=Solimicrobium silvestre TaxID=2099400 RepID=A0A2S9H309_9BURK|nr:type II secretion system minor pseudopilin GspK [Solimicrobium silvestre]PRC94358.1 Type II secretory pathway component PulK [Solimicrobium silvestre]